MAEHLVANGIATDADLTAMLAEIDAEVNEAANKALAGAEARAKHGDAVGVLA